MSQLTSTVLAWEREVKELKRKRRVERAALKPFANLWDKSLETRTKGDDAPIFGLQENIITVGDVRRARAALRGRKIKDDATNG